MSYASDDLTPLFDGDDGPRLRLGQGRLVGWDPTTRENVVLYRGAELTDLPVLLTDDVANWTEGINVSVLAAGRSYLILGRVANPAPFVTPPG